MTKLKIAIFYDWLNQWGGAERVFLNLLTLYPQADIFTLTHDPSHTKWLPTNHKIFTSFINKLPHAFSNPIVYTPFYDIALEQFDFTKYDIVISTTSTIGHCLLTPPSTLFVTYFHNINRHLYSRPYLKLYQNIDYIYSRRPNAVLCNSQTVATRIKDVYNLESTVINPGIDTNLFVPSTQNGQYFLAVSRLVPHKKIDIIIQAFVKNNLPLIIIGTGRQQNELIKKAQNAKNIKFVTSVSDKELLAYYQNCLALICPQLEDFGLSAIEAQACGKPVIAYGRGGITETVVNLKTGVYFNHQTSESLQQAINIFQKTTFSLNKIRLNSLKFSQESFMLNFKQTIDQLWQKHLTTTF